MMAADFMIEGKRIHHRDTETRRISLSSPPVTINSGHATAEQSATANNAGFKTPCLCASVVNTFLKCSHSVPRVQEKFAVALAAQDRRLDDLDAGAACLLNRALHLDYCCLLRLGVAHDAAFAHLLAANLELGLYQQH